jgi:uncharacterized protein YacL
MLVARENVSKEGKRETKIVVKNGKEIKFTKTNWQGLIALATIVGSIIALIIAILHSNTELGLEALKVVASIVPTVILAAMALYKGKRERVE